MGFIYKITNTVSGKCYIGETVTIFRARKSTLCGARTRDSQVKSLTLYQLS